MMTLYRTVKGKQRRYCVELLPTLFGEWIVIRSYGSSSNASPMGIIKTCYDNEDEARTQMQRLLRLKTKKGYCPLMNGM